VQQLKKIAIAGGPSQTLATVLAVNGPPTQSWAQDDNIYFSNNGVLMRIPSEGGQPETLATPEVSKGEMYFAAPQLLPGGGELLVTITSVGNHSRLLTLDLQTHRTKMLLENVEIGQYVGSGPASGAGHLLYYDRRSASLMAVPFNPRRYAAKGAPAPIIEGVQRYDGSSIALLAISDSGTLAYLPGAAGPGTESRLVWVDRKGTEQPLPAAARGYNWVRLSPDGHRIAVSIHEETEDVWVYDIARGALTRITSEGHSGGPIWSPDGQRLIFERRPPGGAAVMSVPSDGSSSPSILAKHNKGPIAPSSLSPDGKVLVGFYPFEVGLWALPLPAGNAKQTPQSLFESEFKKGYPQFSPDGRWIAFTSDESGRAEIYVAPYPGPGGKIQISIDGGAYPRWARNGRELFYRDGEQMMAVEAQSGSSSFRVAAPHTLFHALYGSYDVALDGQRFLMIKPPADTTRQGNQVIVVLNWFEELRRRIPLGRE
jgi:WD40 repeat protein